MADKVQITMTARNLIVVILDTLRADFESLCARNEISIEDLARLRELAPIHPTARCGSFPTGPMRTDLLTGSLSFLRSGWAVPGPDEPTLLSRCRKAGVNTCLVSDNYVVLIPRIGGMLIDLFDTVDFIRGAAADPWTTPDARLVRSCLENKWSIPTRSPKFEAQFTANLVRSERSGESHIAKVFKSATEHLNALEGHERYVLWVDSFACHEPWLTPEEIRIDGPIEPFFPAYTSREHFPESYLTRLRNAYTRRIGETSKAMAEFIEAVATAMKSGDTALLVLSDHGFLFGEFGFVGKPATTPLPPQLHEIVCWLSPHFDGHLSKSNLGMQPHMLHQSILNVLGFGHETMAEPVAHIFGRNSVRSDFLAAADNEGLTILTRRNNGTCTPPFSIKQDNLDSSIPLTKHPRTFPFETAMTAVRKQVRRGMSQWLDGFVDAMAG